MLSIDVIKIFIAIKKEFKEFVKIDLSNMEKFNNCEKIEEKPIQTYKCHVCNEEFDQYGLELHFMTNHSRHKEFLLSIHHFKVMLSILSWS